MAGSRRQLPPWLLGLVIAAGVFVIVLVLLDVFGYGDDPVIDSARLALRL